tara:strand:- start:23 stop:835 length:813 start_codon:yes stop_codon:yes gene_type:complete
MSIYIDCRESSIKEKCEALLLNNPLFTGINIISKKLDVADIVIKNNDESECIYIERKTVSDLSSSIKDGRYREQSLRLTSLETHHHNILYLIEGQMTDTLETPQNDFSGSLLNKASLYTAMANILLYKGFSLVRTQSVNDTAEYIMILTRKLISSKKPLFYKKCIEGEPVECENKELPKYASVIRQKKKDNITTDNIGAIMLSQIPGVSYVTSELVMSEYNDIPTLIEKLKENPNCLDHIVAPLSNGKTRKISKTACKNIYQYLLHILPT